MHPADLILYLSGALLVGFGAAWLSIRIDRRRAAKGVPPNGTILRIRANSGCYRSRIESTSGSLWAISAPIQRDGYVPLRVGEELVVEGGALGAAVIFRTEVAARETGVLRVRRPKKIHRVERRHYRRNPALTGVKVSVDGATGRILDFSEGGAKVETSFRVVRGGRVSVQFPWGASVGAWVMSTEGREARLRFEELIWPGQKETAPVA